MNDHITEETTIPMSREESREFVDATEVRLMDRYEIYLSYTDDANPKGYDEWLDS